MGIKNDDNRRSGECDSYVAICAACGYQWNETQKSTFELDCPACEANLVHRYAPDKADRMGEDYDGVPWY